MSDVSLRYLLYGEDKTASRAIKGVGAASQSTASQIGGAFSRLGSQIGGEFGNITAIIGSGFQDLGEHASTMGKKLTVAGSAITGAGLALQLAGSKEREASQQLKAAIEASGNSLSDYEKQIEETTAAQENFGHGAADTAQALATLTEATGDPTKALHEMQVTADLAAAKHISLAEASVMVARVLGGSGGRTLKQFGITMATTGDKTKNAQAALDELGKKLHGQAAAAVDSFGGKVDIVKTKIADWTAQMGQRFGPVLTALGPTLLIVGTAMDIYRARQVAATTATVAQAAATDALAVSEGLALGPILLVIAGIALLVAGVIYAYKHFDWFRKAVDATWHAIVTVASWAWNNVLKPYLTLWVNYFKLVGGIALWLWQNAIAPAFRGIVAAIQWAWRLVQPILAVWKGILDGLINTMKAVGNFVSAATGGASAASTATRTQQQKKGFGIPHAAGGPVFAGTAYWVGENGPETFVPGRSGTIVPNGGGGGVHNHFNGMFLVSKTELARIVGQALDESIGNGTYRPRRLAVTAH